jgi:hypothetical protein
MSPRAKTASFWAVVATTAWVARHPGFESVCAFTAALAAYLTFDRSGPSAIAVPPQEVRAHDQQLFAKYEQILGEAEVSAELATRLEDCRVASEFMEHVEEWCRLSNSTGGKFLTQRLQSSMENYRNSLTRLGRFVAQHFFLPRNSPEATLLSLLPEHRHMHGEFREMFDERQRELRQIVSDIEAYSHAFRLAVKEEVQV